MLIRTAVPADAAALAEVEALCFPAAEAAPEQQFRDRLQAYAGHFWLMFDGETLISFVDGMVTDVPGLILATFYADCVPLFFVDPVHKAVGLSHSGWRGTAGKIGAVTVEKMREAYGTRPEDLYSAIGPSICQECYEVSEDVIEAFQKSFPEKDWDSLFYKKENGKYQLDLWRANERIFTEAGIREDHIAVTNVCTHCNPDILFSHRTTGDKRGNVSAFLALKQMTTRGV